MYCFLSGGFGYGGGAQSIQVSLLKSLSKRGEKCKLFDVNGGSVHKAFLETKLPFEFIEIDKPHSKKDYSKYLTENDLLIVFDGNFFGNLFYFGKSDCKILVWEIFYPWVERFIYSRHFPVKFWAQRQEKQILKILVENKAFFFIDYLGKEITERRLNNSISDSYYLPIPIEVMNIKKNKLKGNDSKITVSYVGRSVDWKINPFIKIINDFKKIISLNNVIFNVVCDDVKIFANVLQKRYIAYEQFEIRYFERLSQEELKDVLKESDIHFAMGTAALDGAKQGIPTVVIDACYEDFPSNYKYRWIFETDKLILGKVIRKNDQSFDGKHTLSEILSMLKSNKDLISEKCYNYIKDNYEIERITNKIIEYKKSAKLSLRQFKPLFITRYFKLLRQIGIR
jgi:arsenate reductase-like glutaredoxin family protein